MADVMLKDSEKYKIALKFINKILISIEKNEIDDLTKFTDIDRKMLISAKTKEIFTDMQKELFVHFDKVKCGWYKRNKVQDYILTFLKCMCIEMGLSVKSSKRDVKETIDGVNYRKTHSFYSIK